METAEWVDPDARIVEVTAAAPEDRVGPRPGAALGSSHRPRSRPWPQGPPPLVEPGLLPRRRLLGPAPPRRAGDPADSPRHGDQPARHASPTLSPAPSRHQLGPPLPALGSPRRWSRAEAPPPPARHGCPPALRRPARALSPPGMGGLRPAPGLAPLQQTSPVLAPTRRPRARGPVSPPPGPPR